MEEKVEQSTLKTTTKGYIRFILFYVCAYAFVDGYLTAVPIYINTNMSFEFGLSVQDYYLILSIASLGLIAVFGLQVLADIIGRKPTVLISFVGMAVSGVFMAFAQNTIQFTIAFFLSFMFISTDAWVILVAEDGQKEKRGRIVLWIWILSVASTFLGPIARAIWMETPVDLATAATWRVLPMLFIIAIPIALLGFGIKESSAFQARKLMQVKVKIKDTGTLGKVWKGEHRKKLLAFLLAGFSFGLGYSSISTYDRFLSNIFLDAAIVTRVFIIMSCCAMAGYLLVGPIADKVGRKLVSNVLGCIVIGSLLLLVSVTEGGLVSGDKFVLVSILSGTFFAAYWSFSGLNRVHCLETFPTEIRGTAMGWRSFSYALGVVSGAAIASFLTLFISLGMLFLLFSLFIIPVLLVNHRTLPETKKIAIV